LRVKSGAGPAAVRVLEARIAPPYEGASGLSPNNVPGLRRFRGATFTGEYPLATVALEDAKVPVGVTLEAFSPFIPLDAEESGLPVAVLRYRVANTGARAAAVSVGVRARQPYRPGRPRQRISRVRLPAHQPEAGGGRSGRRLAGATRARHRRVRVTHLTGWPRPSGGQPAAVLGRFL